MKALLSLFLLIQLALASGGGALEKRYDCSMSGQRGMRACCCGPSDEAFVGSQCCAGGSCGNQDRKQPSGETSLAASGCCRVHWESTPQTRDFDGSVAAQSVQVTVPNALVAVLVEAIPAPRPAVGKERYPAGVPPGFMAAVPLRLRHCSFLI